MTDIPAQPTPVTPIPKVEELFKHIPHPRIAQRKHEKPVKVDDERVGVNGKVALIITSVVGTMWCAYVFAVLGLTGIAAAVTNSVTVVLIVGAVSGYFLQLVLLPIIIVGQNIQGKASDKRSEQTYKDAEAILSECLQLQQHLQAQDTVLDDVVAHVKQHHVELAAAGEAGSAAAGSRDRVGAAPRRRCTVRAAGVRVLPRWRRGAPHAVARRDVADVCARTGRGGNAARRGCCVTPACASMPRCYEVGPSYRWELVRAARRGVRVRLVLDAHASDGNAATARELIAAGGECRVAGGHGHAAHGKLLLQRRDRRRRHRQPHLARCASRPASPLSAGLDAACRHPRVVGDRRQAHARSSATFASAFDAHWARRDDLRLTWSAGAVRASPRASGRRCRRSRRSPRASRAGGCASLPAVLRWPRHSRR